jgi:enamine deaminase RidA (YjgF/YER057c/UK114 family)
MKTDRLSENCVCTAYEDPEGSSEYYILVGTGNNKFFEDSLGVVASHLDEVCRKYELSKENLVFSRFFFSDIANQKDQLTGSGLFGQLGDSACSFIEQPPLTGDDLVFLLYYIKSGPGIKKKKRNNGDIENTLTVSGDHYSLHFSCNLHAKEDLGPYNQTKHVFDSYGNQLTRMGLALRDNTVRTWLYLNDIDNHYEEVISARRDFFDISGLTKETHYIASTGIGACLAEKGMRISMDALSIENIKQEQVTYLNAPEHLNPTHEYGVTFERGTRILFGDREHFYISGTASINKDGEVVHSGDIEKQTLRAVDNINALLSDHKADINDMAYLIVYLRNINHYGFVEEILRGRIDAGPLLIFVNASICRASWLVEIEGAGIRPCSTDFPSFL